MESPSLLSFFCWSNRNIYLGGSPKLYLVPTNTAGESPELFEVNRDSFDSRLDFNNYLTKKYSSLSSENLYIISGVTEHNTEKFHELLKLNGWEFTGKYDEIYKITNEYRKGYRADCYLSFDRKEQVFLLYTDQRKTEEIEDGIEPFLSNTRGVHYLYISPRVLRTFRESLVEDFSSTMVTEFVAKRTERTKTSAEYRPDARRTFNYYGEDGLETLREVERDYGVLPHIMQINIPGKLKFRVDKDGLFNLQKGSLTLLFEHIRQCVESSLEIKEAYNNTRFQMLDVSETFKMPTSKPATINLRNHLEYSELNDIKESFQEEGYIPIDSYSEEGSLFFSSTIFDDNNNASFDLRVNEDEIRIFPNEDHDIGTFYQFVEFIQNSLDERASVETVGA